MPKAAPRSRSLLRPLAAFLGVALLVYLVERAGPGRLLENARTIGWGIVLVIALAGLASRLGRARSQWDLFGDLGSWPVYRDGRAGDDSWPSGRDRYGLAFGRAPTLCLGF